MRFKMFRKLTGARDLEYSITVQDKKTIKQHTISRKKRNPRYLKLKSVSDTVDSVLFYFAPAPADYRLSARYCCIKYFTVLLIFCSKPETADIANLLKPISFFLHRNKAVRRHRKNTACFYTAMYMPCLSVPSAHTFLQDCPLPMHNNTAHRL